MRSCYQLRTSLALNERNNLTHYLPAVVVCVVTQGDHDNMNNIVPSWVRWMLLLDIVYMILILLVIALSSMHEHAYTIGTLIASDTAI